MENTRKCYVTFKDENDNTLYKKIAPLDKTLYEIAQLNPDPKTLWCEIEFEPQVDHFEHFDLLDIEDKLLDGAVRLTYNFNLDPLLKYSTEEELDKVATLVEKEIWLRDKNIMNIIGANDFAVSWGGPDVEKKQSDTDVVYYIDGTCSFLFIPINILKPNNSEPTMASSMEQLHSNAQKMSVVINEIIEAVKSGMKK